MQEKPNFTPQTA